MAGASSPTTSDELPTTSAAAAPGEDAPTAPPAPPTNEETVAPEMVVAPVPPVSPPGQVWVEPAFAVAPSRFSVAAAMGVSIDNAGIADGRNVAIPSFSIQGGVGQGILGFEARLFASEAAGRFSTPSKITADNRAAIADVGADRQALDLLLAVRPFARWNLDDLRWGARLARALTIGVGAAGERVSVGAKTLLRGGAVVGGYVDLPVTPVTDSSALNVRFAARRMFGTRGTVTVSGQPSAVADTKVELFGGLAVIF